MYPPSAGWCWMKPTKCWIWASKTIWMPYYPALPSEKSFCCFQQRCPGNWSNCQKLYEKPKEITVVPKTWARKIFSINIMSCMPKTGMQHSKELADYYPDIYAIIFLPDKNWNSGRCRFTDKDGYNADALHGDLSQAQRDSVMNRFRTRNLQMLVATDVCGPGGSMLQI